MGATRAEAVAVSAVDLIAQLQDPVLATDLDGIVTAFNGAAEKLYGYPAEAVIGSHASTLIPDVRLPEFTANLEAVLAGGTRRVDAQARTSDGGMVEIAVTCQPMRGCDGTIVGTIMLLRDMSERMLRERQLLFMSRLLGETDSVAVICTNRAGMVTIFNRGAEELLGYTAAEVVGRVNAIIFLDQEEIAARAAELGVPPTAECSIARFAGELDEGMWTHVRKDGSKVEVLLTMRAVIDPFGEVEGFIGVARDISEIRRAELARMHAEERFQIAFEHAPIGLAIGALRGP